MAVRSLRLKRIVWEVNGNESCNGQMHVCTCCFIEHFSSTTTIVVWNQLQLLLLDKSTKMTTNLPDKGGGKESNHHTIGESIRSNWQTIKLVVHESSTKLISNVDAVRTSVTLGFGRITRPIIDSKTLSWGREYLYIDMCEDWVNWSLDNSIEWVQRTAGTETLRSWQRTCLTSSVSTIMRESQSLFRKAWRTLRSMEF